MRRSSELGVDWLAALGSPGEGAREGWRDQDGELGRATRIAGLHDALHAINAWSLWMALSGVVRIGARTRAWASSRAGAIENCANAIAS